MERSRNSPTELGFTPNIYDMILSEDLELDDLDVGPIGGMALDLDL